MKSLLPSLKMFFDEEDSVGIINIELAATKVAERFGW
jgi:hypothetical protein